MSYLAVCYILALYVLCSVGSTQPETTQWRGWRKMASEILVGGEWRERACGEWTCERRAQVRDSRISSETEKMRIRVFARD